MFTSKQCRAYQTVGLLTKELGVWKQIYFVHRNHSCRPSGQSRCREWAACTVQPSSAQVAPLPCASSETVQLSSRNTVSFSKFMESIFRQLQDWNYNNTKHTNNVNLPWYTSWWNTGCTFFVKKYMDAQSHYRIQHKTVQLLELKYKPIRLVLLTTYHSFSEWPQSSPFIY